MPNKKTLIPLNKTFFWLAFLVTCITFISYLPALNNDFVVWDDNHYIFENLHIQSINVEFIRWSLTSQVVGLWLPLTMFSHALDYAVWGLEPAGHHLTNVILHALNTFLVFIMIARLCRLTVAGARNKTLPLAVGFSASLLFGIHPIHVESVAWASERKDLLCAFFFLLTILTYLKYVTAKKKIYMISSIILFSLALMSKPMAVSLPITLLILDYYPLSRLRQKEGFMKTLPLIYEKIPFLLLSTISSIITIYASRLAAATATIEIVPFSSRLFTPAHTLFFYLSKIVAPIDLAPLYPYRLAQSLSLEYVLSFILLVMIFIFCIWYMKRGNGLLVSAWGYYFFTLLPVIGLVQVGSQSAADRYTYLPSIAPFTIIGLGAWYMLDRYAGIIRLFIATLFLIIIAVITGMTIRQIDVWEDTITLWSHEIDIFPDVPQAYCNRGIGYYHIRDLERAITDYTKAIKISTEANLLHPYISRASAYMAIDKYEEAVQDFTYVIERYPQVKDLYAPDMVRYYINAYNNRGNAYSALGHYNAAIRDYLAAVKLDPQFAEAYVNLGIAYSALGDDDNSILNYNRAIEIAPENAAIYYNRASAYKKKGNYVQAIEDYSRAVQLEPQYYQAYYNRANLYILIKDMNKAIMDYTKVIELRPKHADAFNNRGNAYSDLGNYEKAISDYSKAIELNPDDPKAYLNRANVYKKIGNIKDAELDIRRSSSYKTAAARKEL